MKGPTVIGLLLLLGGIALYLFTPGHVTWGNHHYVKHWLAYGMMGVGAIFTLVGARSRG